jgi:hypothetical protein
MFMEATPSHTTSVLKASDNWDYITAALRLRFPLLTDKDLFFEPGKEGELIERLQITLNRKHEDIMNLINRL